MSLRNLSGQAVNYHHGFTLIEVLIAVVILALGLLGLAGLQSTSLRNNQSAYFRSQATLLAYDIADRVRANSVGDYNNQGETNNDCVANTCTPAQMAGYDLKQWNSQLSSQLPRGEGVVCKDKTPGDGNSKSAHNCDGIDNAYAVKIWWDDDHDGAATQRFAMSFQP